MDCSGRNNPVHYLTSSHLMCTYSTCSCAARGFVTDRRMLLTVASIYCLTYFFFYRKRRIWNFFPDNTSALITCTSECKTNQKGSEDNLHLLAVNKLIYLFLHQQWEIPDTLRSILLLTDIYKLAHFCVKNVHSCMHTKAVPSIKHICHLLVLRDG